MRELSTNAKRVLATIYQDYCQRREYGKSGPNAVFFMDGPDYVKAALPELSAAGYTEYSILNGFILTEQGVSFMRDQDPELVRLWA